MEFLKLFAWDEGVNLFSAIFFNNSRLWFSGRTQQVDVVIFAKAVSPLKLCSHIYFLPVPTVAIEL